MNKSEALKRYCDDFGFTLKKDTKMSEVIDFLNCGFKHDQCEDMRRTSPYGHKAEKPKFHARVKRDKVCDKCGRKFVVVSGLKRENAKMCRTCSK